MQITEHYMHVNIGQICINQDTTYKTNVCLVQRLWRESGKIQLGQNFWKYMSVNIPLFGPTMHRGPVKRSVHFTLPQILPLIHSLLIPNAIRRGQNRESKIYGPWNRPSMQWWSKKRHVHTLPFICQGCQRFETSVFFSEKINISTTGGSRVGFFQPDTNHP